MWERKEEAKRRRQPIAPRQRRRHVDADAMGLPRGARGRRLTSDRDARAHGSLLAAASALDLDLVAFRLRLAVLRKVDGEDPLVEGGADLGAVDDRRERERPLERAVGALDQVHLLALVFRAIIELLSLDRQNTVFDAQTEVAEGDARQLRRERDLLRRLDD